MRIRIRIPLQAWYDAWLAEHKDTDLIYAKELDGRPTLPQVHFVRDTLAPMVWADTLYDDLPREPPPRNDCRLTAWVIAEHCSKSVRLPVYSIEREDIGIRLVLRDNYYNWKLSVISERPIDDPLFPYLFHTTPPVAPDYTGDPLDSVYFEGFPEELVFGYHAANHRRWSAELGQWSLRTVVFLCMKALGVVSPAQWHTRESHRAKLDAETAARKRREQRERELKL